MSVQIKVKSLLNQSKEENKRKSRKAMKGQKIKIEILIVLSPKKLWNKSKAL